MKRVKASMKEQLKRKASMLEKYHFLKKKADTVVDIGLKNTYRGDAEILRYEMDRITCYINKCTHVLSKPEGPNREELDKLYNFKYWRD